MSLLVILKILGLFVNTLTADDKYSLGNRENLRQPIQKELCKKQKPFTAFFAAFLKSTLRFEHFETNMRLVVHVFPKLENGKNVLC